MEHWSNSIVIGIGATAVMDLWGIARHQLLSVPPPDYGLVGRWLAWTPRGTFRHDSIAAATVVRGERIIGWSFHYLVGIAFAGLLVAVFPAWLHQPTILPALSVGIATVVAPFLVLQPGMGAGIAASRTKNPWTARLHSLITHAIFGLGLYVAGHAANLLYAQRA